MSASRESLQISSCASRGNMPSIMWCAAKLTQFHAVDAHARASSAPKVTTAANSSSAPPTRRGWWMRKSSASWKSAIVASGSRRSSSQRGARSRSLGSSASARAQSSAYRSVPVKDLGSGGEPHARPVDDVVEKPLNVGDAVRHAAYVRMHADRHYACACLAFLMQPVEVVDAAAQPFLRAVVCDEHHRDVVHLDRVGHRDDRT